VQGVHRRVKGSYAVIALIAGHGLLAFRDPFGIRPLCIGKGKDGTYMVASESVALEGTLHQLERNVAPGEAIFIDLATQLHSQQCADAPQLNPCIFEFVYLARPDSIMDGISVYQARLNLGETLAKRVISTVPPSDIDVVIPIPESSRPSAAQLAQLLGLPYREGFVKNRYVGRTFIMPGQSVRKKSVRQKLNAIASEFKGRNVLLVDDSIVRGTTSREIVQMAREAGARKVYMASAAPPVRFPNVYGIDMPTTDELVAHNRTLEEIRQIIDCDALIYQDVDAMKSAVANAAVPGAIALKGFDASCFDGVYITGDVTPQDIARLNQNRPVQEDESEADSDSDRSRLALPNASE
jgi:amidophosphoribosyltransferase